MDAPFPAINPSELGDVVSVDIDKLLIPYLLGALQQLIDPTLYSGDPEDVQETVYAFQNVLDTLNTL